VLKQVAEQQFKLLDKFDADVSEGKAQLYDWELRDDGLRQYAAERAAVFKIADWKEDELLALAALYQRAEVFPAAIEALRAYLKEDAKSRKAAGARLSLVRVLIETAQYAEAEKLLAEMRVGRAGNVDMAMLAPASLGLYKDLATAWRDLGQLGRAAEQAEKGLDLAGTTSRGVIVRERLNEIAQRDEVSLAALFVSLSERLDRKKEADEFQKRFTEEALKDQPPLKSIYENELISARMIGKLAPELTASRWLDGQSEISAKTLSDLRGKVVLLNFWAMWNNSSIGEFPRLAEFQKKFGGQGLEIIGVTRFYGRSDIQDDLSREREWKSLLDYKSKYRLAYPIAVGKIDDLTNDEQYGIAGLPAVVLIDRRGNVRLIKRGAGEYRKLEKQIEKLVSEN